MDAMVEPSVLKAVRLPENRALYYGGSWHEAVSGERQETFSPSTGESLGAVAWAGADDVDRAVLAAKAGFLEWRQVKPLERARVLREAARLIREHGEELALIDAADCGNPIREMVRDASIAADGIDFSPASCPNSRAQPFPWATTC